MNTNITKKIAERLDIYIGTGAIIITIGTVLASKTIALAGAIEMLAAAGITLYHYRKTENWESS